VSAELDATAAARLSNHQRHERQEAATRAVNHMTLRHRASASITVHGLGRIDVEAVRHHGEIDIAVRAQSDETAAVLSSVSHQLEHQLRKGAIELGNLAVQRDSVSPDGREQPRERPRQQPPAPDGGSADGQESNDRATPHGLEPAAVSKRVPIVL